MEYEAQAFAEEKHSMSCASQLATKVINDTDVPSGFCQPHSFEPENPRGQLHSSSKDESATPERRPEAEKDNLHVATADIAQAQDDVRQKVTCTQLDAQASWESTPSNTMDYEAEPDAEVENSGTSCVRQPAAKVINATDVIAPLQSEFGGVVIERDEVDDTDKCAEVPAALPAQPAAGATTGPPAGPARWNPGSGEIHKFKFKFAQPKASGVIDLEDIDLKGLSPNCCQGIVGRADMGLKCTREGGGTNQGDEEGDEEKGVRR